MEGGGIHVRAPSVAIDFNIDPIFNTGCFIQYEVSTEPFSLDPSDWKVQNTRSVILNISHSFNNAGKYHIHEQYSWYRWCCNLCHKH